MVYFRKKSVKIYYTKSFFESDYISYCMRKQRRKWLQIEKIN